MKNLVTLLCFLIVIVFSACKKEKKNKNIDPETPQNGNISIIAEAPNFIAIVGSAISPNGNYIYINPDGASAQVKINNSTTWKNTTIEASNYTELSINNNGYLLREKSRNNYELWNLNTNNQENLNLPGFYNSYYLGHDNTLYCYASSNSQSTPSVLYYRQISATKWDTLHATANILGQIVGVSQDGIALFNVAKKELNIINYTTKIVTTTAINVDLAQIRSVQGNKPLRIKYSGADYLAFADTKGCALVNLKTNTTQYTIFPTGLNDYYENPKAMSVCNTGEIFIELASYVQTASWYKCLDGNIEKREETSFSAGALNAYISNGLDGLRATINKTSFNLDGYTAKQGTIISGAIANNSIYYLLRPTLNSLSNYLYKAPISKGIAEYQKGISGNYNYLFADNNTIIINGPDSGLISTDGGNSFSKTAGHAINYIRQVGGMFYGMQSAPFKYYLGGTGFSIDKHKFQMSSSINGKDWTPLSGAIREQSGTGPLSFTNEGYLNLSYNTDPLGNPSYVFEESTNWGANWSSAQAIKPFNLATESKIYYCKYNNNKFENTIYDIAFNKEKTIEYTVSNATSAFPVQAPLTDGQSIFIFGGGQVLKLSL